MAYRTREKERVKYIYIYIYRDQLKIYKNNKTTFICFSSIQLRKNVLYKYNITYC